MYAFRFLEQSAANGPHTAPPPSAIRSTVWCRTSVMEWRSGTLRPVAIVVERRDTQEADDPDGEAVAQDWGTWLARNVAAARPGLPVHCRIDIEALHAGRSGTEPLRRALDLAAARGAALGRVTLLIDAAPHLDAGIVYTLASDLRRSGVGIALCGIDADGPALQRIAMLRPAWALFDASWCHQIHNDPAFTAALRGTVSILASMGVRSAMEGLGHARDIRSAAACGVTRFVGDPALLAGALKR